MPLVEFGGTEYGGEFGTNPDKINLSEELKQDTKLVKQKVVLHMNVTLLRLVPCTVRLLLTSPYPRLSVPPPPHQLSRPSPAPAPLLPSSLAVSAFEGVV